MRIRVLPTLVTWLVLPACSDPAAAWPQPPPEPALARPAPMVETAVGAGLRLGATLDLSGPDARMGRSYTGGLEAAFAACNEAGGVHGHRLELAVLDDRGRAAMAARNARTLLENAAEPVLALTGVGPLCGTVVLTIAQQHGVLLYAPVGAGLDPTMQNRNGSAAVLRAGIAAEMQHAVRVLVDEASVDPARIALVTQRDSAGEIAFAAGMRAITELGVKPEQVRHQRADRQSTDIERHVEALARDPHPPQACVLAADASVVTAFLLAARATGLRGIFLCTSRVVAEAIEIHGEPLRTVVLQAVDPGAGPGVSGDAARREGFYAGRILVAALQRCATVPDRALLTEAMRSLLAEGPARTPELAAFRDQAGAHGLWPMVLEPQGPRLLQPGEMATWGAGR